MTPLPRVGVKICGINTPDAFDAVVEAGADWLAFNFFERSPRYVTAIQAAALSARHDGGPQRVGLFVAPSDDDIVRVLDATRLDILQLYAPAPRVAALRARFALPVWRPLGVSATADLPPAADGADALLIEAKAPPGATRPGGNAAIFNWDLLAGWQPAYPWLLAGGLTPLNVAEAIRRTGAPGVDVASGVESAPGVKDPALIHAFVQASRAS